MFNLVDMTDTVKVPPWLFEVTLNNAIKVELNRRYANRVIHNTGLCICLFDILRLEDSFIFPGDGSSHTKVHFRFIVFRPFIDEILFGKIKVCSSEGITVSMGFFDDIIIPSEELQHPSKFNDSEQLWVWEFDGAHDLFMEINDPIKFQVIGQTFNDTTPLTAASDSNVSGSLKSPYSLTGSISSFGLGLSTWWSNSQ